MTPGTANTLPEGPALTAPPLPSRIVFFDGVCVLCNGFVHTLLEADRSKVFTFASLQGETATRLHGEMSHFPVALESIVYLEDGRVYLRSQAVLRIARLLPYPWRAFSWLRVLPRVLSDFVYRCVARVRYAVFGKREVCMIPEPDQHDRFLP